MRNRFMTARSIVAIRRTPFSVTLVVAIDLHIAAGERIASSGCRGAAHPCGVEPGASGGRSRGDRRLARRR
jgi:hypothetical protein